MDFLLTFIQNCAVRLKLTNIPKVERGHLLHNLARISVCVYVCVCVCERDPQPAVCCLSLIRASALCALLRRQWPRL